MIWKLPVTTFLGRVSVCMVLLNGLDSGHGV
jgi:hypothetical protein